MRHITRAKAKDDFFTLLETVQNGEHVVITGDRENEKLAVILPYRKYSHKAKRERTLGILKGKADFGIKENFKITDEELFLS